MSENFTMAELLIRYLDNDLAEGERKALEEQIAADDTLAAELSGLRLVRQGVKLYGIQQAVASIHAEAIAEIRQQKQQPQRVGVIRRLTRYSIGVAAAAIIVIGTTIGYQYATVNSQGLYNDIYSAYTTSQARGTENRAIKNAYAAHNLQQVIQLVQQTASPTVEDYYFAGNANLQLHNTPQSIEYFIKAQGNNKQANTGFYSEDIEYYLALAYLQNNQPGQALPLLTTIYTNAQHAYHDKITRWQLTRLRWLVNKK